MAATITATQFNVSITAYDATGQTGNARNFNGIHFEAFQNPITIKSLTIPPNVYVTLFTRDSRKGPFGGSDQTYTASVSDIAPFSYSIQAIIVQMSTVQLTWTNIPSRPVLKFFRRMFFKHMIFDAVDSKGNIPPSDIVNTTSILTNIPVTLTNSSGNITFYSNVYYLPAYMQSMSSKLTFQVQEVAMPKWKPKYKRDDDDDDDADDDERRKWWKNRERYGYDNDENKRRTWWNKDPNGYNGWKFSDMQTSLFNG